jgi:Lysozyme like domain/Ricin-type beta-trefoil lectin domain
MRAVTASRSARMLGFGTLILVLMAGAAAARGDTGPQPAPVSHTPLTSPFPRPASLAPQGAVGPLSPAQALQAAQTCAAHAATAGWADNGSYGGNLVTATAVCVAESGGQPNIYHCDSDGTSGFYPPVTCAGGLYDRGLWQINSTYHLTISDTCAFRAQCNADAAYGISAQGASFAPWAVYGSTSYTRYLDAAQRAVSTLGSGAIPSALFGMCVARSQNTAGAAIVIRRCARRHAQEQWTIIPHTIYHGTLCLSAGAGGGQPAVTLAACDGSDGQIWNTYRGNQLRIGQNGDCLDDPGASRAPGTALDTAPCTATRQETWWLP